MSAQSYWDKIYTEQPFKSGKAPLQFLIDMTPRLQKGKTLDVGMGEGANAVFLAQKGFQVKGFDISPVAIERANKLAKETGVNAEFKSALTPVSLASLFARLLPVIRHLISIPAGIFRMDFYKFSIVTIVGSGLWCWILALFGERVLGESPQLLESPEQMVMVLKSKLIWFVAATLGLLVLYFSALILRKKLLLTNPN